MQIAENFKNVLKKTGGSIYILSNDEPKNNFINEARANVQIAYMTEKDIEKEKNN